MPQKSAKYLGSMLEYLVLTVYFQRTGRVLHGCFMGTWFFSGTSGVLSFYWRGGGGSESNLFKAEYSRHFLENRHRTRMGTPGFVCAGGNKVKASEFGTVQSILQTLASEVPWR